MAQRTIVTLEDDIIGGPAEHTVAFSLDGRHYDIDLNTENRDRLGEAFGQFIAAANKVKGNNEGRAKKAVQDRKSSQGGSGTDKGYTPAEVRVWAASEGITVNERGRINAEVIGKYEYAHGLDKK